MRLIDADAILKADENSDKALVLGSGKSLEIAYALLKKKVADAPHRGCRGRDAVQGLQAFVRVEPKRYIRILPQNKHRVFAI